VATSSVLPHTTGAESVYLVALAPGFSQREYRIVSPETFIGRDGQRCSLVAVGPTVSRCHALLSGNQALGVSLEDCNSTNGLFVNGERIVGRRLLHEGDLIGLGTPSPHLRFQWRSNREPRRFVLPAKKQWLIGRDPACDLALTGEATVSANHGILSPARGGLLLEDNQSLNGTWVNGRARRHYLLQATDTVLIGSTSFRFQLLDDGSLAVEQQDNGQAVHLEGIGLGRTVKSSSAGVRILLDQVNICIPAGTFVGILGPSGAGKTTLLTTLSGSVPPDRGWVLCNETPLASSGSLFRTTIGSVPQDDILHQELSVESSLDYVARLRLSQDLSSVQRQTIVNGIIETLALQQVRHQLIGQLSGGQRKRVSLGAELLVRPGLLFLDEPTAGLDPATEQQLMHSFRSMADQGTTVVMTTHLLSHVNLFDKIAICAQGNLVFFGTPQEATEFFAEPGAALGDLTWIFSRLIGTNDDSAPDAQLSRARKYAEAYRRSSSYRDHVFNQLSATGRSLLNGTTDASPQTSGTVVFHLRQRMIRALSRCAPMPMLRSWAILSQRDLRIRLGSMRKLLLYLLVPIVLALVTLSQPMPGVADNALVLQRRTEIAETVSQGGALLERQLGLLLESGRQSAPRSGSDALYALRYEGAVNLPVPMGSLLMMVMSAVFCGVLIACLEICGERSIYLRDRQSYLQILPYIASKLPCCFVLTALQNLVFLALCLLVPVIRQADLLALWGSLVAISWSSVGIGLLVSSLDPSGGRYTVMAAVAAVLPQLLLSGGIGPEFFQGMSSLQRLLADLLPARWGLEMVCTSMFAAMRGEGAQWVAACIRDGIGFDFGRGVYYNGGSVLLAQLLAWLLLCAGILHYRDHHRW